MTLEELRAGRNDKVNFKTDWLGLKKVGGGYLLKLQDTAEYNTGEANARKYDLIHIYRKLSTKLNKHIKTEDQLKTMSTASMYDYIAEMLCDLCGYDH